MDPVIARRREFDRQVLRIGLEPLEARQLLSVTTDDQGWTVFGRSADTRIIYVSNSSGNDANTGLSESAAVKTLAKAKTLIRNGAPDWMLLKRGDAWTENLTGWNKSGRSAGEMMVLGAYGTGDRPTLNTGTSGGFSNSNTAISNLAIVGINFHAHTRDTASPTYAGVTAGSVGFTLTGNVRTMLLEDVVFDDYTYNLSLTGQNGRIRDFTMRRSIVTDAWSTDGKAQGLYADEVDGFVLEENVFDHNGWNELVPGAAANIYSHGVYMSSDNNDVVVRGNVVADSSSHGVMARSGGVIEDNVFLRNPMNLTFGGGSPTVRPGGVEGHITGNVFLDSRSIAGAGRGTGVELSNLKPGAGVLVADNIFTADTHRNAAAITFNTTSDATNLSESMGINDLSVRDNIVYDWYSGFSMPSSLRLGGTGHTGVNDVRVEDNDFQNTAVARIVRHGRPVNTAELFFGANRYASTFASSGWFEVNGTTTSYDTWKVTAEPTALLEAGAYVDPARSIASYNVSLGGDAAFTAFTPLLRAQDRFTLDGRYTAAAIINYVRAGFAEGGVVPGGELALHGASTTDATPAGVPATDPADTTGPGATLSTAPVSVTSPGIAGVQFTVTYTDASAVDLNSIGTGDVKVTGPNAYNQNATLVSKTTADNGKTVVAVYSAPAPGGYWDVNDAGTYTLALVSGAAKDTLNNSSASNSTLGTFTTDVPPDTTAPTVAAATLSDITTGGTAPQTFTITYTDQTAVDVNTIGAGDVLVTLPDGTTQSATYVSRVASNNNKTVVATYSLAAPGAFWDVTDNGTYAFALANGAVADVLAQTTSGANLGSFVVNVPWVDIFAPVPTLNAPSQATAGVTPYTFTVTFTDDTGVDPATIDASDITVTGPGGAVAATFVGQQSSNNGETITATFRIAAPGGYWDAGDNGSYQVALANGIVKDVLGNTAAGQSLGAIGVNVAADIAAPTASLTAATVTAVGSDLHTFTVTYTDSTGVDVSTLGDGDVQVTGSASYSQLADFVSSTASADGKTVTATYTITAPGGEWDFFDNGAYAVRLTASAVKDLGGNANASGQIGTFDVLILDTVAPVASLAVSDITTAGGATQSFTITYDDDLGINFASIGAGDVRVVGPSGTAQVAALASKVSSNGGKSVTATYTIAAPGGAWDRADNGTYSVDIASAQVSDLGGNLVAVGEIGSFAVNIADMTAPTASLVAGNITAASTAAYTLTVTYSDDTGVDPATIGDGDVTVTGPGGYSQPVALVSTQSPNAQTVVVTYSVPARGGDWDFADNGTYSIALAAGAVSDASGNPIAAASPLGTFTVNVPQPADTTAPTASLIVSGITSGGGATHTFTVTYTDDRAIDVSSVGTTGVSATGPGGYNQAATLVSKTATDAKTVVATYSIPAGGGAWDPADNGTYTVTLIAGAVADAAGNANIAGTLGTFVVNVPDTTAPTAMLAAANITAASSGAYTFTVTYADELAIDPATVGAGDVIVTGPGGFSQVATFVSKTSPNGKTVIGTYSITGPGGAWDFADNGSYTVAVPSGAVHDVATNPVAAGAIGGFSVSIAQTDTTAPVASLPAVSTITTSTTAAKSFTATFTDAGGINVATLGAGDVLVTGPNGYSQAGAFVSQTSPDGGKTVNAVYSVSAPGGTWDAADNGTYTITLTAAAVQDVAGNATGAATLGGFSVNIAAPPATLTVNTSTSAYVRDGGSAKRNFGSASDLQVRKGSAGNETREAYIRFDLTGVTSVSNAKLRLNGKLSGGGSIPVAVFGVSDTTWSESSITWNTKPAASTPALASKTMTNTSYAVVEWDVTAYLQQLKAAGATAVTFVLKSTAVTNINATFRSDDYSTSSQRPQLVVTQGSAPAGVPSIVTSKASLIAPEGGSDTFTVALSSAPVANVTVNVARTGGDTNLSASPGTLTFTPGNWNVPQIVTVNAAQDTDALAGSATFSVSASGLTTRTVIAAELDDDIGTSLT